MNFKNILITGAAGFIGSHVYDYISSIYIDASITILDKMTYAANIKNIANLSTNDKHNLVVGDLVDPDICFEATKGKDLIIHLAAESHVDNSFNNSIIFSRSNTLGTHTLMEACKRNNVKKIIHFSTDEVFGENIDEPFKEEDRLNPTNPYSASKAAAEMIVNSYFYSFNLPVIIVRANNIYGIRQYPEKIIPKFITRSIKGQNLQIHGDGSHLRHYLSVKDVVTALNTIISKGQIGHSYNVSADVELSNIEVANKIKDLFPNKKINIEHVTNRPFNDSRYAVNDKKLRLLNWKPKYKLTEELPTIIDWYSKNLNYFN